MDRTSDKNRYDVAVVGAGLAGLTAAALLSKAGKSVLVLEQSDTLGGRATTRIVDGFHFNLGPHALYRGGHAMRVLGELGIAIDESPVGTSGSTAVYNGEIYPLPVGLFSILNSPLLTWSARMETLRFLASIPRLEVRTLDRVPLQQWLDTAIRNPSARRLIHALIRVSTYSNAPLYLSAGSALDQFRTALRGGVIYLHGGWRSLVDRLHKVVLAADVTIQRSTRLHTLSTIPARTVILAIPPQGVAEILGPAAGGKLLRWIEGAKPVQAACIDLGLRRLPEPGRTFAVGLDRPTYFSVHSRWADLAPSGKVLVQVARYLSPDDGSDPARDRAELEGFLDVVQPQWRDHVEQLSFMPKLTVTHAVVSANDGGFAGRPAVDAPAAANVYVAGDWVGSEGMLADAAFASAQRAAQCIIKAREPVLEAQAV